MRRKREKSIPPRSTAQGEIQEQAGGEEGGKGKSEGGGTRNREKKGKKLTHRKEVKEEQADWGG